jgi:hypothetical protein
MIILLVIAIVAVAAPVAGVLLVAMGIRREDAALSLSYQPTGALQSATRRLLGFHGDGLGRQPMSQGGAGARPGHGPWTAGGTSSWINGDGTFPADDEFVTDDPAADPTAPRFAGRR